MPVRDLSAPWTFRGGGDPEHVWLRLTTGLAGSSMPAYAYALLALAKKRGFLTGEGLELGGEVFEVSGFGGLVDELVNGG